MTTRRLSRFPQVAFCATAPLRKALTFAHIVPVLVSALAIGTATIAGDDVPATRDALARSPVVLTAKSWPLFRGDPQAQGVAKTTLPEKPELLWRMNVEQGAFEGTPAIVDGVVYIGDADGKVYALNLSDGKEVWHYKVDSGFIAAPAIRDRMLYIGDIDGKFHALDIKTGESKWTFQADATIDAGANFWKDNVLFGSQDANLYSLDCKTGELVWKFAIQDQIRCSPTIVGDRSFVAGCDSLLHIIDLTKGEEAASVPIESPTGVTPAVLGDHAFFGTEAGALFAVNWKEAKVAWTAQDKGSSQAYRSSPAVQDGILVVGSRSRRVEAYDPATGKELWMFDTRQRIDSSPVIVGNRVFVGAADGRLYGIDLKTGKETWQYQAAGGFVGSPAVADGKLVIATDRGVVYCFGSK